MLRLAESVCDISMDTGIGSTRVKEWIAASFSITVGVFHGCIGLAIIATWRFVGQ